MALECCSGFHFWGEAICEIGHDVKLIPAQCVKLFIMRQKNNVYDAAIVGVVNPVSMHTVQINSSGTLDYGVLYRSRALFVKQRTQTLNKIRGDLAEFGLVYRHGVVAF